MSKLMIGDCCIITGGSGGFKNLGKICYLIKKSDNDCWCVKGNHLSNVNSVGELKVKENHLMKLGGTLPLSSILFGRLIA